MPSKVFSWDTPMIIQQTEAIIKVLQYLEVLEEEICIPLRIIHFQKSWWRWIYVYIGANKIMEVKDIKIETGGEKDGNKMGTRFG